MYVKSITYRDFDDVQVTDNITFNLTRTELLEWVGGSVDIANISGKDQDEVMDGAKVKLTKMMDFSNGGDIISFIKDLVLRAYGEKSADGKRFVKVRPDGTRLADEFVQSMAFDALLSELLDDPTKADEFLLKIMPSSLASKVKTAAATEKVIDVQPNS